MGGPFGDGFVLAPLGAGTARVGETDGVGLPACLDQLLVDDLAGVGFVQEDRPGGLIGPP